ncbi:response regulator [Luteibacter aegosomaticola]|uniref:response regulator n=1 Tax=Luteibacter aegosomaticola TaxID=2911538 RepID=UPI001FFB2AC6|nr:response regulator [Luteibacter aegosomaticola]UPG88287.1 response regulator [Luteibacter aegosomaticola]
MAQDPIEDGGFRVVSVPDAASAIRILETRLDIRIVFTDIDMPGDMDGILLAAAIRRRWPPIEIVMTSSHVHIQDSQLPERGVFVSKPYDGEQLLGLFRTMATRTDLSGAP